VTGWETRSFVRPRNWYTATNDTRCRCTAMTYNDGQQQRSNGNSDDYSNNNSSDGTGGEREGMSVDVQQHGARAARKHVVCIP